MSKSIALQLLRTTEAMISPFRQSLTKPARQSGALRQGEQRQTFRLQKAGSILTFVGLGLLSALPAHAAPASAASVEKLVAVNGAQKALETAVAGVEAQVRQQVITSLLAQNGGTALTPQQQIAVDKAVPGIGIVLRQEMGWAKLKTPYIALYQSQLSQAEVDRLTQLYQDPAYVTLMQKMQVVNQQSAQLIVQKMPAIMQRVAPVLEDALKAALGQ